ncbi:hypothetical protein Tco_1016819 [Tanacetum coccineum]|uniref:Uncharacterized protein n=1 Tax=Tanacetum coccineum TaxID=301880 RepID=A0ABQ5FQ96_9ASTR
MIFPLAEAFTKSSSVVYQNFLREFWCTTIAYHPNPPTDDFEARPFKEYLIKFSVMNGKKPLTLDFKTFTESTRLDYAKGKYVSHPSTEEVKVELAKIVDNPILLDRTPVLKTAFPVAWRIQFTFVVQVLGGNYSSTEQVNSIQQLFAYCLLTGTKVDIGEIIYSDLITRLTNKSRQKYVSYPRFVSCTLEVLLGSEYTHDESFGSSPTILSNSNFSKDPSKVNPVELTAFMVAVNNNEKSVNPLPFTIKKRKGSLRLGNVQSIDKGLPSTASDKGTVKTTSLPEGPHGDKDSEGLILPIDMEPLNNSIADPSGTGAKYQVDETQPTRLRYRSLTENEGKTSSKVEPNTKTLQLKTFMDVQALLLSDDEMVQASDDEELFAAGEEMDEDIPPTDEEVKSPPPNTDKPESSHTQDTDESASDSSNPELKKYDNILLLTERQLVKYLRKVSRVLFNRITEEQWAQHEEATVSYANLRTSIEGYYEENVDHRARLTSLFTLNGVTETLKVVQEAVKDDPALNKKVIEATEAYIKKYTNPTELLTLVKSFDFHGLMSTVESLKATALNTSDIKSMMTKIYQAFKEDDIKKTKSDKTKEEPTRAVPISIVIPITRPNPEVAFNESSSRPQLTYPILEIHVPQQTAHATQREGNGIATDEQLESTKKLVLSSKVIRGDPDEPIRVPYMINGKMHYLTNDEINAHLEKEDKIKKAAKEAKRLKMTKTEVIKIVQEEAKNIGIDPKKIISAKAGEKFKKAQDAEVQVHKKQHTEKAKRLMELNKKRAEQYKWTISSRLKPEPITDVKMHPNSKPEVLTVYKNNDKRNFQVHSPFKFTDFEVIELDELGLIIEKKKNTIIKDLMTSLGKRYERLKKIPEEIVIQSALPAPIPDKLHLNPQEKRGST